MADTIVIEKTTYEQRVKLREKGFILELFDTSGYCEVPCDTPAEVDRLDEICEEMGLENHLAGSQW